jgi:hypothetical protein
MSISAIKIEAYLRNVRDEYFFPLKWLLNYVVSKALVETLQKREEDVNVLKKAAGVTVMAVCLNQGTYLQYSQLAAERHRRLKESLDPQSRNTKEVTGALKELVDFMNREFFEAAHKNFELLHVYFGSRSKTKPRICIKGNFRIGDSDKVITVFRDKPVKYEVATELSLNTGFSFIEKTGTYFLDNDIISSVKNRKYFNPRLDPIRVQRAVPSSHIDKQEWLAFWDGATDPSEAYQSTLIIPMTLWNNQLNGEFRKFLQVNEIGRTIFGYLCIDHAEPDYFIEKVDSDVGYAFADLMSMYLFSRKIYIEISRTYAAAKSALHNAEVDSSLETLVSNVAHLDEVLRKSKASRNSEGQKSSSNTLLSIDRSLIKFIGADAILGDADFPSSAVGPNAH